MVLACRRNPGSLTYDGIEVGAERVAREIEDLLEELGRDGYEITKFSVIGYSLGGLVARYAIGLLYHKGYIEKDAPDRIPEPPLERPGSQDTVDVRPSTLHD